ncbi:uncharacterized protein BO97DRAFT_444532 [Aspergillus homomorphus CBS 101889]|uniref:F-box domain-containing protein n=1 Tax=Aspergillus homomorphus (strain CBS 101889) TaxID=1450537 RepID=A0A395HSN2_ASPHC|nr:hypothetical protein BO97DRAFT_444532 [Aspergillus homomorphus CBS 101889]RAL10556.1 hypothetical protein BO97DRAFT_444532 [Aspergillus homomorphus CBS 101889]
MSLTRLPPELFSMVAAHLSGWDLLSLYAVSVGVMTKIHSLPDWIMARSLRVLCTDLSNRSLSQMHGIAQIDILRKHVQVMRIEPPFGPLYPLHRVTTHELIEQPTQIPSIKTLKNDLVCSLTNCRSFEICLNRHEGRRTYLDSDDVLNVLLHIFVEAALPVEHLSLYTHNFAEELRESRRARPDTQDNTRVHKQPDLARAWSKLTSLQVTQPYYYHLANYLYRLLPRILRTAPKLERLILIGDANSAKSRSLVCVLKNVKPLAEIKHLEIRRSAFRPEDFEEWLPLIGRHLRSLKFSMCSKISAASWTRFFRCVRKNCPLLEAVAFEEMQVGGFSCLTAKHEGQRMAAVLDNISWRFEKAEQDC